MKYHVSQVKLVKNRGLQLLDLLLKYPQGKEFNITYEEIYKYYNIKKLGYNCYAKICGGLFIPHIISIKKNLGIDISYKKIDNEKMCFKYYVLK